MKNKLRKYAMLYINDLMEEYATAMPDDYYQGGDEMTVEEFMQYAGVSIEYHELVNGSRIDMYCVILVCGEEEAVIKMNVAR